MSTSDGRRHERTASARNGYLMARPDIALLLVSLYMRQPNEAAIRHLTSP